MPNGNGWHILLRDYFTHHALTREQAEECVTQLFLRYSTRSDAPAWGVGTPPPLFWTLAHDVLCEHFRQQEREQRQMETLRDMLVEAPQTCPQTLAVDRLDAERFASALPDRLREVLALRLQGFTCAEIAEQLSLSVGTVKAYLAELRNKFVKYYGYHPTKTPCLDGNVYGSLSGSEVSALDGERRDAHEEVSGLDGGRSVRGKRVGSASHSRRARRARGGGGPDEPVGL